MSNKISKRSPYFEFLSYTTRQRSPKIFRFLMIEDILLAKKKKSRSYDNLFRLRKFCPLIFMENRLLINLNLAAISPPYMLFILFWMIRRNLDAFIIIFIDTRNSIKINFLSLRWKTFALHLNRKHSSFTLSVKLTERDVTKGREKIGEMSLYICRRKKKSDAGYECWLKARHANQKYVWIRLYSFAIIFF